ncbi:YifB family Mg chelatase-like AAA ATPase [Candidatus Uhrbacteria bacterium]|nr:YifB family Mg chelatase-like AAA ATPase [Candidatus Uhrbacteria bacterium]
MSVKVFSAAIVGLGATPVEVEADVASSLPSFTVVGLPDKAVEESRERVRAAIKNSGIPFPRTKVTVNLAPADIKKEGPQYDLPIALAIVRGEEHRLLPEQFPWEKTIIVGELALDGSLRPIRGVLAIATAAARLGMTYLFVPEANAAEAALVHSIAVIPVKTLVGCVEHIQGVKPITATTPTNPTVESSDALTQYDFAYIQGQEFAKRALEIAAAGGHHTLFAGPPGSGKTILARALPTILPPLTFEEALDATRIHSIAGTLSGDGGLMTIRPFRQPHHTASDVSIVGGGATPRPGEVSLAHRGVLFLDEFPEFDRNVLEALRQPLEDGMVTIARAQGTTQFPAQFMLVAAQNPCPCGYKTDREKTCVCTPSNLLKYEKKISGPILDRIDLFVDVPRIHVTILGSTPVASTSATVRARVAAARTRQQQRFKGRGILTNAEMRVQDLHALSYTDAAHRFFDSVVQQMKLSGRGAARILKVAQTIADLADADTITEKHVGEAVQYRKR